MGCKLDDFTVNAVYKTEELNKDSFNFLNLTGRKALWSKGYYGQGLIGAVVDSGVSQHKEFGDRLLPGKNFNSKYRNKGWHDDNMHGTHCAGTMAGLIAGIAPKAKILPIKVLDAMGGGEWPDITNALNYLADQRASGIPIVVASMSLSGGEKDITTTEKRNLEAAINKCYDAGILPICSMGNTAKEEKRYPACFNNVVAVGSVDENKQQAMYATKGSHVDITARGTNIISAYFLCNEYAELSGTSMSTPQVAGGALILANEYKDRYGVLPTAETLKRLVLRNAKDLFKKGIDDMSGEGYFSLQPLTLKIKVEHGSNIAYVNNEKLELPVAINMAGEGHTMVPLRFIAEHSGAQIKWFPQTGEHGTQSEFEW